MTTKHTNDGADAATEAAFAQASSHKDKAKATPHSPAKHADAKPSPQEAKTEVEQEFRTQKKDRHFKIIVPSTGKDDEVKRIFVGVNGVPYTFVRDEPIVVPKCVLDALDIALETRYKDGKDADGNKTKVAYKVKSYAYQILEEVEPTAPAGQVAQ
ncbi:MAG: hypothetical protein ACXWHZ_03600 [Usitatibacter sp.]